MADRRVRRARQQNSKSSPGHEDEDEDVSSADGGHRDKKRVLVDGDCHHWP